MSRQVFIYGLIAALFGALGVIEYTTYVGDLPPILHVVKVIIVVGAISTLLAKAKFLTNKRIMSILSALSILQLLYIVIYERGQHQVDESIAWNLLLLILLIVFFVFLHKDKTDDSH